MATAHMFTAKMSGGPEERDELYPFQGLTIKQIKDETYMYLKASIAEESAACGFHNNTLIKILL